MSQTFRTKNIEYTVKKGNRRKTVAISINSASQVIVLAPEFLRDEKIEHIVAKKYRWILEKQKYFRGQAELYPEKEFVSGEQILLFGRRYRLRLNEGVDRNRAAPVLEGRRVAISCESEMPLEKKKQTIKTRLIKWYCTMAEEIVIERIKRYSRLIGVVPREIKIKDQEKRWGSCSLKGVLRFNWRIAMTPVSIIDYIVVHELCHLAVKNHSADFWEKVGMVLPDYQKRRDWLRNNSALVRL